ncbi:hypothetical protein FQA39_LY18911 [Lamprigera yunnana]|nr:hypothetical protein FQA39_LY18911 [Lamprigera yunnana]
MRLRNPVPPETDSQNWKTAVGDPSTPASSMAKEPAAGSWAEARKVVPEPASAALAVAPAAQVIVGPGVVEAEAPPPCASAVAPAAMGTPARSLKPNRPVHPTMHDRRLDEPRAFSRSAAVRSPAWT